MGMKEKKKNLLLPARAVPHFLPPLFPSDPVTMELPDRKLRTHRKLCVGHSPTTRMCLENERLRDTMAGSGTFSSFFLSPAPIARTVEALAQAWANYGPGTICGPVSFVIQPNELEKMINRWFIKW